MDTTLKSDKMGKMPVQKLLFYMSMPAIFSMLVQALYNIVDSIFVSRFSEKALEAVSIAFPLQMLIIAFGMGIGVGTNAFIARKLGEKKLDDASLGAQTGLFLIFVTSVVFVFLGIFVSKPFVSAFTADAETLQMSYDYLFVVLTFSVFAFTDIYCGKVFQATGNMKIPMLTQCVGAIVNIVLDPLFIFGVGALPALGTKGAAIATVIGQFSAMMLGVLIMAFTKQDVKMFFKKNFRLKKFILLDILKVGLPTIIMKSINSFTVTILNMMLKAYAYAITVLGVLFKLQSFIMMPVFGLTQGAMPILGYNFGGGDKKRFTSTFKLTLLTALFFMVVGVIIFQALPAQLMGLFNAQGELLRLGIVAIRIMSISYVFASVGISVTISFQALGNGFISLCMSLLRQVVLLLPTAALLLHFVGINGAWAAYPISEAVVAAVFLPIFLKTLKKAFEKHAKTVPAESDTQKVTATAVEDGDNV